jgi:hypothetical protein
MRKTVLFALPISAKRKHSAACFERRWSPHPPRSLGPDKSLSYPLEGPAVSSRLNNGGAGEAYIPTITDTDLDRQRGSGTKAIQIWILGFGGRRCLKPTPTSSFPSPAGKT